MTSAQRFIVGIDLGTTNSAVSFVDLTVAGDQAATAQKDAHRAIRRFKVPQLTAQGEVSRHPVLPSFLYLPGDYDIDREALKLPWDARPDSIVGVFARDHGAEVPARLVSSAKSWLCHAGVDRHARILPWGAGEEVYRVSPVQATSAYLEHIRCAWNAHWAKEEDAELENQLVIITVPASFDQVARDLTVEAARQAGLKTVTLLEEPLAAFYSWLMVHENSWQKTVTPGELILICDVGGGTTDFTLVTLRAADGSPRFDRIAVGDHLILGGDNIDLALARKIEQQVSGRSQTLSSNRWKALCHQCRQAKERILDALSETEKITLIGTGSSLIAGTVSAELNLESVRQTVIDGFFPLVRASDRPAAQTGTGIAEFGLPYATEPAITRHLGWFLDKHQTDIETQLEKPYGVPEHILFNGGSLKPQIIQERIREALRHWFDKSGADLPQVLDNPDPNLAVSIGAAYYGLVKLGQGVRVGSGSPRAYYLGVDTRGKPAGDDAQKEAICLVERGVDEGSRIAMADVAFEVRTNQPVRFDVYSSSFRSGDRCGDIVAVDDSVTVLPPIETVIQFGKKADKTRIPVHLEAEYTEIGTLALWCRSNVSPHRWKLQFQLRETIEPEAVAEADVFDEDRVAAAVDDVVTAFDKGGDAQAVTAIMKTIANTVDASKDRWPLGFIRTLGDALLDYAAQRRRGPVVEGRWYNLTGFCLRPGFGDGFDPHRIQKIWKLYTDGPLHPKQPQVISEWWIMWRRLAGGLNAGQQRQFVQDIRPMLMPVKRGKKRLPPQQQLELWMTVANMERLHSKDKIQLGRQLLSEIKPKKSRPQHLWALGRIGAREMLYGPADRVIDPKEIERWVSTLLDMKWRNLRPLTGALVQMARLTGDRTRDLDAALRDRIVKWLTAQDVSADDMRPLQEAVPMATAEQSRIFGESLPSGLIIATGTK